MNVIIIILKTILYLNSTVILKNFLCNQCVSHFPFFRNKRSVTEELYTTFYDHNVVLLSNSPIEFTSQVSGYIYLNITFYVSLPGEASRAAFRTTDYVIPGDTLVAMMEEDEPIISAQVRYSVGSPPAISQPDRENTAWMWATVVMSTLLGSELLVLIIIVSVKAVLYRKKRLVNYCIWIYTVAMHDYVNKVIYIELMHKFSSLFIIKFYYAVNSLCNYNNNNCYIRVSILFALYFFRGYNYFTVLFFVFFRSAKRKIGPVFELTGSSQEDVVAARRNTSHPGVRNTNCTEGTSIRLLVHRNNQQSAKPKFQMDELQSAHTHEQSDDISTILLDTDVDVSMQGHSRSSPSAAEDFSEYESSSSSGQSSESRKCSHTSSDYMQNFPYEPPRPKVGLTELRIGHARVGTNLKWTNDKES